MRAQKNTCAHQTHWIGLDGHNSYANANPNFTYSINHNPNPNSAMLDCNIQTMKAIPLINNPYAFIIFKTRLMELCIMSMMFPSYTHVKFATVYSWYYFIIIILKIILHTFIISHFICL